jgi:hypothetical protein
MKKEEKPNYTGETIPINVNDGSRTHVVGAPAEKTPAPGETVKESAAQPKKGK